jgi:hypothetical protein
LHLEVHGGKWMTPGSLWGPEVVSHLFYVYLPLRLLYGLAVLEEDAIGANLGSSLGLHPCDL